MSLDLYLTAYLGGGWEVRVGVYILIGLQGTSCDAAAASVGCLRLDDSDFGDWVDGFG